MLNKDTDMVTEQSTLIILDRISDIFRANNDKDTKPTIHITIRIYLVRNDEECNFYKTVGCEGGIQLADFVTKNVTEDELNHR